MERQQRVASDAPHVRLRHGDHLQQELVAVVVDGVLLQRRAALADEVEHHQSTVLLHAIPVDARQRRQEDEGGREESLGARLHARHHQLLAQRVRRALRNLVHRRHALQHRVLRRVEGDERGHAHLHDVLAGQAQLHVETGQRAGARLLDLVAQALRHAGQKLVERRGVVEEIRALQQNHGSVVAARVRGRLQVERVEHDAYE